MKKHQNRFLFSAKEADYYISKLSKAEFDRIEVESKLLILNLLLTSKQVRHYELYKRNYSLVHCKSQPIVFKIESVIRDIECRINTIHYYSFNLYSIIDWIRAHTIRKK